MTLDDAVKLVLDEANKTTTVYPVLAFKCDGVYYVGISPYPDFNPETDVGMCYRTVQDGIVGEPMNVSAFAMLFVRDKAMRDRVARAMENAKYYSTV